MPSEEVSTPTLSYYECLAHNLGNYGADVRGGAWQEATIFTLLTRPISELSAMTLGIVGYGELGKGVARIGEAFGMEVIVAARPGARSSGWTMCPLAAAT